MFGAKTLRRPRRSVRGKLNRERGVKDAWLM